jgi:choline transport protein
VVNLLIPLINIGSPAAFNAVLSLLVSSFYLSFILPCYLLLWRRSNGTIFTHAHRSDELCNTPGSKRLVWGPWRMPPALGFVVNSIACAFATLIFLFSFWPQATPVDPVTMNYSVLVSGTVMLFSMVYYFARGRHVYIGPVVETGQKQ